MRMKNNPRAPYKPKKPTLSRLENIALYYLQRYETSASNLHRVLMRRVEKAVRFELIDQNEGKELVDETLNKAVSQGWIDDQRYGEMLLKKLRAKGTSKNGVKQRLLQKGIGSDLIDKLLLENINEYDEETELQQAILFAKRKRIGPYCIKNNIENRSKHLAMLARQGFSADIAYKVMQLK